MQVVPKTPISQEGGPCPNQGVFDARWDPCIFCLVGVGRYADVNSGCGACQGSASHQAAFEVASMSGLRALAMPSGQVCTPGSSLLACLLRAVHHTGSRANFHRTPGDTVIHA